MKTCGYLIRFFVLSLIFGITEIIAEPYRSLPYILPFEIKLSEFKPQSNQQSGQFSLNRDEFYLQFYTMQSREITSSITAANWLTPGSGFSGAALTQSSFLNLTYMKQKSFFLFDIQHDLNRSPDLPNDLQLGTSLAFGRSVSPVFALILGFKSIGIADPAQERRLVIDTGKIFFTPGIQLRSRSIVIETFLELPIYAYDHNSRQSEFIQPNDIRANLGIKYQR